MWNPSHRVCVFLILLFAGIVLGLGTGIAVADGMSISSNNYSRDSREIGMRAGMGVLIGCLVVLILLIWLICKSIHRDNCECSGVEGQEGDILPPVDTIEDLENYSKNLIVFSTLVFIIAEELHVMPPPNPSQSAPQSSSQLLQSIPTIPQGGTFFDESYQSNPEGDILINFANYKAGVEEFYPFIYTTIDEARDKLLNWVYDSEKSYEGTWELALLTPTGPQIYDGIVDLIATGDTLETLALRSDSVTTPFPDGLTLEKMLINEVLKFPLYSLPNAELFRLRVVIIELPP